eukprot:s1421_g3.t1
MSRGGARRNKVPEVDTLHLADSLVSHVQSLGVQAAFSLGKYASLERQQAVVGPDLVDAMPLLKALHKALHKVEPGLQFKYSDLVEGGKVEKVKVMKNTKKKGRGLPDDWKLDGQKIVKMTYPTGAVALRVAGGKQLLQVNSNRGKKHSEQLADQCLTRLKTGQTLGSVRTWKNKALEA